MLPRLPHLRAFARSIVRIDEHGSKDRAKDASPNRRRRSLVPPMGACAWWRMRTTFPSSAPFGHPLSSARPLSREDTRERRRTDLGPRSDHAPRRAPPSRRPGCLSPPRTRRMFPREGIAPSGLRAGSPAHAAHTLPPGGDSVLDWALRGHGAVTRGSVTGSRVQTPFLLAGTSAPGTDDPSAPSSSFDPAVDEG
jgi:hypothetical protein